MPLEGVPWDGEERPETPSEEPKDSSKNEAANKETTKAVPQATQAAHKRIVHTVRRHKQKVDRFKEKWMPGAIGEIFTFLFALLLAYLFIQTMGFVLNTAMPLVVVESESMVHDNGWQSWLNEQEIAINSIAFDGGMGIGDIIIVKGDDTDDIDVGEVIIYQKLRCDTLTGGEPIIHRVVGIVTVQGETVSTQGAVRYEDGVVKTPCNYDDAYGYPLDAIRSRYAEGFGFDTENFRLFITKGDNPENTKEDQCLVSTSTCAISYPIHEDLVVGKAKFDIPYLGYVKLGMVCGINALSGNVCPNRCWWPASHPQC